MVAVGGAVIAATGPEMLLAARLALAGCKSTPVLCLNQAGIYAADDEEGARNNRNKTNVDDLIASSSKGQKTTGRSKLFERTGGSNAANKEFASLSPTEIKDRPGGRVGLLPDGRAVVVRERSTDGRPTLEIQSGKNRVKYRYDE